MASALETAIRQVQGFLADCEPARYSSEDAVRILTWGVELERQAQALKLLFFERAAQSNVWLHEGFTSPEQWFAELSKGPLGEAISAAETSKALEGMSGTKDAVREGKLSRAQAEEITRAAKADPAAEAELLALAEHTSLKGLRDRSRQLRAQSASRQEEAKRYEAIARRRSLRFWTDPEGALCFKGRVAPDTGARARSVLEDDAEAIYEEARKDGRRESHDAYLADAFVARMTGGSTKGGSPTSRRPHGASDQVLVLVDHAALERGHVRGGERCEIAGQGPVPVSVARRSCDGGADVWALFHAGTDIRRVTHVGRTVSKAMQVSLHVRDEGRCQVRGCEATHHLEAHHWREPYALAGTTTLDNLVLVCPRHHDMITYRGWTLEGGPGAWQFRGPPEEPPERIFDTG